MLTASYRTDADLETVRNNVRDRVLWLSTAMVHWANHVRRNPDGAKVGGHQASSASSVALLSALFFETMDGTDRVAIKPHASPVYHAIQYLLRNLPGSYLTRFRGFKGLQAYPSRTKDPDGVDFSTGAVGLAAPAVTFGAFVRDYLRHHGHAPTSGRFFAHIGDAELDEGTIWECVAESALEGLARCVWIVDLNRQSLDRVVPGIRVKRFRQMFDANGWTVIDAKYGDALSELMARPGGHALRRRIDEMSNEEYQGLLVAPWQSLRQRLLEGAGPLRWEIQRCLTDVDDTELVRRIANLGGHDIGTLTRCYRDASLAPGPAVVFAYTVKGWGLHSAADPRNHAALLSTDQFAQLADEFGLSATDPWQRFPEESPEGRYLQRASERMQREGCEKEPAIEFQETRLGFPARVSTQSAFGRMLVELDRTSPESARRMVTVSPDVAASTNLASWINRANIWSYGEEPDFLNFSERTVKWVPKPTGRHIELGISESNLFILLGQLGLAEEVSGTRLIPIGTLYDPFIARGLDPLVNACYMGAKFIAVATPSGVSLSSEGGAHQGVITPSIMTELPGAVYYEPCFAREVEWILLDAVRRIGKGEGESVLLRLGTKPIDQALFAEPVEQEALEIRKRAVLTGCYRLRSAPNPQVNIFAMGPMVPEAVEAAEALCEEGVGANVLVVTSPDLLFRQYRSAGMAALNGSGGSRDPTGLLSVDERSLPIVTVLDGHPHTLSFLGTALQAPAIDLGSDHFGESGTQSELYQRFRMDGEAIYLAALAVIPT